MNNLEKFFEAVYNESHVLRLNEVSVSTFSEKIKRALGKGENLRIAGAMFGKKFAEKAFENTLQPRSNVLEDINVERFNREHPDINTKMAEVFYKDLLVDFSKENHQGVKDYFDGFLSSIQAAGVQFEPSSLLGIR